MFWLTGHFYAIFILKLAWPIYLNLLAHAHSVASSLCISLLWIFWTWKCREICQSTFGQGVCFWHFSQWYFSSYAAENHSWSLLPLKPPKTLLKLFQTLHSRSHVSCNSPLFPLVRHTSDGSDEKPIKGSFFLSTSAHILYLATSCVLICMLTPQIYLAFKHMKLHTLVRAMTLQRLPTTEAMSAFEIPNNKEVKLICQDPWVFIAVTIITLLGITVYLYRTCSKMTLFKCYLYDNMCTVYLSSAMIVIRFLSNWEN